MLSIRMFGHVVELHVPAAANGAVIALQLSVRIFMQEMRDVEELKVGRSRKRLLFELSVITVAVHDVEAPVVLGVLFGVPIPRMEMPIPLGTVIPEVHTHVPAGMVITSPSTAVCLGPLMIALTSLQLQDAAL
jgi:hypothetical protein